MVLSGLPVSPLYYSEMSAFFADMFKQIAALYPDDDLISVFMPTGMLPPTGFVCFVPRANVTIIGMSVEDAAKIIISAGMVRKKPTVRRRTPSKYSANSRAQAITDGGESVGSGGHRHGRQCRTRGVGWRH